MDVSDPAARSRWTRRSLLATGITAVAAAELISRTVQPAHATTTVLASSFGYDPDDATVALQAALDSTADIVVIDDVGTDWITRPLFIRRDDLTVLIEPGVIVGAKVGGFPSTGDCLITIDNRENITLLGHRAELIMNKSEYTTGEWRMGVSIRSCRHIVVEGLTIRDSGGDGIYLGVSSTAPTAPRHNTDITLRNVVCDNHRRNGLSVVSVDGLLVEGCVFSNASGTNPQAGIDFEPNQPNERLTGIIVRDTVLTGSEISQLMFYLVRFDATTVPLSILIERVLIDGQPTDRPVVTYTGPGDSDPGGSVELRDTVINTVHGSGVVALYRRSATGIRLTFRRCVLWDWGNGFTTYRPIVINAGRSDGSLPIVSHGALDFDQSVLITDQGPPMITTAQPTGSHLTDVTGLLTVIGPASAPVDYGDGPVAVTLDVEAIAATPHSGALGATVSVSPVSATVVPGTPVTLTFTRTGGVLTRPLAAQYGLGGTAQARVDYTGVAGSVVFAAGANTTTVTIATRDAGTTGPRTITPTIVAQPFYL